MRCGVRVDVVIRYMCIFNSWLCCFNDHYVAHKCMHTHPPAVLFVEGGRGGYGGVHVGVTFIKASLVLPPSDGIGRTGTFCAAYSMMDRVKVEQVVDAFQTIKSMRIQRAGLLDSLVR